MRLTDEERADNAMSESLVKAAVREVAIARGWKLYTLSQVNVKRPQKRSTGYPDITLARRGVVKFIECKRQQSDLEPEQIEWRNAIVGNPLIQSDIYLVARPASLRLSVVEDFLR